MELMRGLAFIALLFAGSAVGAELRQAEVCGDGTTHQAGYCPAVLSSASCSATGATTGSCSATSDEADGTRYVCATSNNTALTCAEIIACSGGSAIAGASAAETGSNTIALSGLTTDAAHYGQNCNLSPEQWPSNRPVSSSFTPTSATSDNATRIDAILDNYTLPAALSGLTYPTDPVITDTSTCAAVTSATQFNNCADDAGTRITVTASFSGNISITADDIDVVMDNAYTITGNLSISEGTNRVRWTGGTVASSTGGAEWDWRAIDDLLLDDVVIEARITLNTTTGVVGSRRVAFINTTVDTRRDSSQQYTIYSDSDSSSAAHEDFIFANVLGHSALNSAVRLQTVHDLVVVESAFNPLNTASTGFRLSSGVDNAFVAGRTGKPTYWIGRAHLTYVDNGNAEAVTDATWDKILSYRNDSNPAPFLSLSIANTGTVSNHTHYSDSGSGSPVSVSPFSDGGGNANVLSWVGTENPWDLTPGSGYYSGSAPPIYTSYGASH